MALGTEVEKKRDAAQMSAAAVGFFLDREGHKKFLRVSTNQELEAENTTLKVGIMELIEHNDNLINDMRKFEAGENHWAVECDELRTELNIAKRERDHFKKASEEQFDKRCKAEKEMRALELRIQKAIRKALHPDMPDTEDEATSPEAPSDPSERASTIDGDVLSVYSADH